MRNLILVGAVLAGVVFVGSSAARADLGDEMSDMGKALKALGKDTADLTNNAAALADVSKLEAASLLAKDMTPPKVAKIADPDAQAKALADYRKLMGNLIKGELDLEAAIIDKDADGVKKDMGVLVDTMKEGHTEFRKGN